MAPAAAPPVILLCSVYWTSAKHAADVDNRSAMAQKLETARFIPHSFLVFQLWPDIIERPQAFKFSGRQDLWALKALLEELGGIIAVESRWEPPEPSQVSVCFFFIL